MTLRARLHALADFGQTIAQIVVDHAWLALEDITDARAVARATIHASSSGPVVLVRVFHDDDDDPLDDREPTN